ncbi:hypothetical protein KIN20_034276 [Parelaphostrongylus tenuis]|uniref:Uncharacterized protein n=1 Tax=Parelaphostrongylus tenuis TaxID=148309 RepID=A0AAD5WJJ4_PARTN|nr:hypothetical protein KIN20_034276 [Parelaphostrongylus tenuis]
MDGKLPHCTIVDGTVTGTCPRAQPNEKCMLGVANKEILPIPTNYTTVSGTLMTTNIIMVKWSKDMWQSVVKRALRMFGIETVRIALLLSIR